MTPEDTISQNWNSYRANDPIQMKKKKQTMGVRGSYYRLVDLKKVIKELHVGQVRLTCCYTLLVVVV